MNKVNLNVSIVLILSMTLFGSCKVKSQKTVEDISPSSNDAISIKDLSNNSTEKLNPDEALVSIRIVRVKKGESELSILAEITSVNQRSFGFNASINAGDSITIDASNQISLEGKTNVNCVIKQKIRPNTANPKYQLIKLI